MNDTVTGRHDVETERDRASSVAEVGGLGEGARRSRSLEDDVVGALGPDARPERLRCRLLRRVPRRDSDLTAGVARDRRAEQTDRAGADDGDPLPLLQPHTVRGMQGDGQGLHEARVAHVETYRQGDHRVFAHHHLVCHGAVARQAVHAGHRRAALRRLPGQAAIARAAVLEGEDRHLGPLVGDAAHLVAERERESAEPDQLEVGPADARGDHLHPDTVAVG